jgi:hypothetical protein
MLRPMRDYIIYDAEKGWALIVVQFRKLAQKDVVRRRTTIIANWTIRSVFGPGECRRQRDEPTPFCFHAQEYPYPTPKYLQYFHDENPAFHVVEAVEAVRQLDGPCEAQQQVQGDGEVVNLLGVKEAVSSKSERVFGVVTAGGEQGQIPILSDVPIEGVYRVDEYEE